MPRKAKSPRSREQKSATLKWHIARDYLLPTVDAHIRVLKREMSKKNLTEDQRYDMQFEMEAWNELKKEMS